MGGLHKYVDECVCVCVCVCVCGCPPLPFCRNILLVTIMCRTYINQTNLAISFHNVHWALSIIYYYISNCLKASIRKSKLRVDRFCLFEWRAQTWNESLLSFFVFSEGLCWRALAHSADACFLWNKTYLSSAVFTTPNCWWWFFSWVFIDVCMFGQQLESTS